MDNIICRTCHKSFKEWGELATHIHESKDAPHKKDRAGILWAKRFIHRNTINKMKQIRKREFEPRQALTDKQKEAKQDTRREISGSTKYVPVRCPRCNGGRREMLEVEHANNPQAWKLDNCYVILCGGCR